MEELKIDIRRAFVVINPPTDLVDEGDRVVFLEKCPQPTMARFKSLKDNEEFVSFWHRLAYAEEPNFWPKSMLGQMIENEVKAEQPYIPRIGDRVSLEGEVKKIEGGMIRVGEEVLVGFNKPVNNMYTCLISNDSLKLLSRKSPRRVTKEEVNSAFGEEVTIID